eukprot:2097262-Rhodomonas_salina.1
MCLALTVTFHQDLCRSASDRFGIRWAEDRGSRVDIRHKQDSQRESERERQEKKACPHGRDPTVTPLGSYGHRHKLLRSQP